MHKLFLSVHLQYSDKAHLKIILCLILFIVICSSQGKSQQKTNTFKFSPKSTFTENKGQITDQHGIERKDVKYLYAAPEFKLILKGNSFSYELYTLEKKGGNKQDIADTEISAKNNIIYDKFKNPEEVTVHSHRVDVNFIGANPNPEIIAEEKSSDYNNYYLAHTPEEGIKQAYNYNKLTYKNLYPNIDIVFYAREEGILKYDIVVHPGGRLENVKMQYDGPNGLALENEALKIRTTQGIIEENIPKSYSLETNEIISVKYLLNNNQVSFKSNYNKANTLIIDPKIIWGTYLGGNLGAEGKSLITDDSSNVYLIGTTQSFANITTVGAHQTTIGGSYDALVTKFSSNGARRWSTYYGGSQTDGGSGISKDKNGNIIITGYTISSNGISTYKAYQPKYAYRPYFPNYTDAFIAKFNNLGYRQWGTYYGGLYTEQANSITSDDSGNVYIAGYSGSDTGISTINGKSGSFDAFIAKFNNNGIRQWGTYYGSGGDDRALGISIDKYKNLYITGYTESDSYLASSGAHQTRFGGYTDAFIAKFDKRGKWIWGSYYGGNNYDYGNGIGVDDSCNIFIAGRTYSDTSIATAGAFKTSVEDGDAFLVKFDSSGSRKWGTYFGGPSGETANSLCVDSNGSVFIIGNTSSTTKIATPGTHQTSLAGYSDIFIAKFRYNGAREWSTYYGGSQIDNGSGVTIEKEGDIYLTGYTYSSSGIATPGAFKTTYNASEAFLAKFFGSACSVSASFTGAVNVCQNAQNLYVAKKGKNVSYKWEVNGGIIISGQGTDSLKVFWNNTGFGLIKLVVSINSTCKDSLTKILYISSLPFASTGKDKTICAGESTVIGSPANAGSSYSWTSFPAGFTSNQADPKVSPSVTTTYILKETISASGCSKIDSVTVTVNPLPRPLINGNTSVCAKTISKFGTKPVAGSKVAWHVTNGTIIDGQSTDSILVEWTIPGNGVIKLIEINNSGCKDSSTLAVSVLQLPIANFSTKDVCIGQATSFKDSSKFAANYLWNFGDGDSATVANPVHIYKSAGIYLVQLTVTSINGCKHSITKQVGVNPLPVADFSWVNTCLGENIRFINNSTGNISSQWNFGDGGTDTIANPSHLYMNSGIYTVKLITKTLGGCIDTISKIITINPLPFASIAVKQDTTVRRTYTFSSQQNASQYLWSFGDGTIDSGKTVKHTF